jgi:hypothetical protein
LGVISDDVLLTKYILSNSVHLLYPNKKESKMGTKDISNSYSSEFITDGYVKTLRIIFFAIATGPIIFWAIILFLFSNQPLVRGSTDLSLLNILSAIHAIMLITMIILVNYIFKNGLIGSKNPVLSMSGALSADQQKGSNPQEKFLGLFHSLSIMRLAILEGTAFFGMVVCFLAGKQGVLSTYPIYWLNAISTMLLASFVLKQFPSKEKIMNCYQTFWESQNLKTG